jgi:hypothetical protein
MLYRGRAISVAGPTGSEVASTSMVSERLDDAEDFWPILIFFFEGFGSNDLV